MNWFKNGKGICQGWILPPCLFNLYVEYVMWNARLDEAQAGIPLLSYDPTDVANLISGSFAFSKTQLVHLEVIDSHTAEA